MRRGLTAADSDSPRHNPRARAHRSVATPHRDLQPVHAGESALQIIMATICVGVNYVGYSGVLITEQVSVS